MQFHVMTLFPELIMAGMNTSILGRAIKQKLIGVEAVNIRDYTEDKHKRVDDYPYGGGAGMVMRAEPIYNCYNSILLAINERRKIEKKPIYEKEKPLRVIYLTPQGKVFHQKMAWELAKEEELVFLCGHYEGVDERALELIVTDSISIGDYVLTGGELPAMVLMDAISRLIPGVLSHDSIESESFEDGLLEYPQYTRPEIYMEKKVPEVLLSGHHAKIEKWRKEQSYQRTKERRPDLLKESE